MNITLIGMSGAGKSHIGKPLASSLALTYLDTDTALEIQHGKPLSEILKEYGDAKFVELESALVVAQTDGKDGYVISTGGSMIYSAVAMEHLASISTVVYLQVPFAVIEERIGNKSDRTAKIVGLEGKSLRELYDERAPKYSYYADIIVDAAPESVEHIVKKIISEVSTIRA